ncbi:ATP-grasp fold amidoligase family protein [Aurantiacibacter rhizosphaerae]|uniref:Polysaccharide biosynthesis protein n=1 Tax=Aurantiacibacter rhizosphaerae TaxID=2691582 RepID=A0A844XB53_9SPHN|nr:ATP-grasp fold amidoligase family protein [Aurantiacibacter rhizosphaerae]MWV27060.1 hypothetical protein [Aurantiacibacter rhizosphaerae]
MNLRSLPALPHWLVPSSKVRIALTYAWRHGRFPNLRNPTRFSELVQQRKLVDRDPAMTMLANKVAVKSHVRRALGDEWVIDTYWSGATLPDQPHWPYPFILKAAHGCNQNVVCHEPADWDAARQKAIQWTARPYGLWLDEWAYRDIPRGYIVEPFLGERGRLPVDYKIYVFGGIATFVQVHLDRAAHHRWILYDRSWRQISMLGEREQPAPACLHAMMDAAEVMAKGFDFARVDFYEIDGAPKFGEVTFYPGSGLDPFDPPYLDAIIGEHWLAARGETGEPITSGTGAIPATGI